MIFKRRRKKPQNGAERLRGKRGIKVTGALRSAGFQKIPARPQIVFNRFIGLNMLVYSVLQLLKLVSGWVELYGTLFFHFIKAIVNKNSQKKVQNFS